MTELDMAGHMPAVCRAEHNDPPDHRGATEVRRRGELIGSYRLVDGGFQAESFFNGALPGLFRTTKEARDTLLAHRSSRVAVVAASHLMMLTPDPS